MKAKKFILGTFSSILTIAPITLSSSCGDNGNKKEEKLPFNQDDFSLELKAGLDKTTKLPSEVKESDFEIKSINNKYSYTLKSLTRDDSKGKLTIEYEQFDKNYPNESLGTIKKELNGFKTKTPTNPKLNYDETDLKIELDSNINKNEKLASQISNTDLNLESTNGKYSYTIKDLTPNDQEGKLTILVDQFDKNYPGESLGVIQKILEGFKLGKLEKDEADLDVTLDSSIDKDKTSIVEIKEKNLTASSKSDKYLYKFVSMNTTASEEGKLVVKYNQFDKNYPNNSDLLGEIEFTLEGFQKVKKFGEVTISSELTDPAKKSEAMQKIQEGRLEYTGGSNKFFGYYKGYPDSKYFQVLEIQGELKEKVTHGYDITSLENQIIANEDGTKKWMSGKVTTVYDNETKELIIKYKLGKWASDNINHDITDQTIYYLTITIA